MMTARSYFVAQVSLLCVFLVVLTVGVRRALAQDTSDEVVVNCGTYCENARCFWTGQTTETGDTTEWYADLQAKHPADYKMSEASGTFYHLRVGFSVNAYQETGTDDCSPDSIFPTTIPQKGRDCTTRQEASVGRFYAICTNSPTPPWGP